MPSTSPGPSSADARPRRADARRNHDTILATARDAFAEGGSAVSMAEIARRSGVGMATLYRNFPDRQSLLEALYLGNVRELARSADDLAGLSPWDALTAWLRRFADFFAAKQAIAAELLDRVDGTTPVFSESRRALMAAARPLLDRAQQSGDVRTDTTLGQVIDMIVGIAGIPSTQPGYVGHILDIALDGLRAPSQPSA
jgi:AcrR family transcriptional regulator